METKELLLHLTKKLESGELQFLIGERKDHINFHLNDNEGANDVKVGVAKRLDNNIIPYPTLEIEIYNKDWNEEFKDKFYKEKGVKCWVKDCPNKILVEEGDHKKVKIPCNEKHTRLVCVDCSSSRFQT